MHKCIFVISSLDLETSGSQFIYLNLLLNSCDSSALTICFEGCLGTKFRYLACRCSKIEWDDRIRGTSLCTCAAISKQTQAHSHTRSLVLLWRWMALLKTPPRQGPCSLLNNSINHHNISTLPTTAWCMRSTCTLFSTAYVSQFFFRESAIKI